MLKLCYTTSIKPADKALYKAKDMYIPTGTIVSSLLFSKGEKA
jgi:hypothetical protein